MECWVSNTASPGCCTSATVPAQVIVHRVTVHGPATHNVLQQRVYCGTAGAYLVENAGGGRAGALDHLDDHVPHRVGGDVGIHIVEHHVHL